MSVVHKENLWCHQSGLRTLHTTRCVELCQLVYQPIDRRLVKTKWLEFMLRLLVSTVAVTMLFAVS